MRPVPAARRSTVLASVFCLLPLVVVCGCGPAAREFERPSTFAVTGKVTVDGAGVSDQQQIMIEAVQDGAKISDGKYESSGNAVAKDDGSYEMGTFKTGDGLRPGKYKLVFRVATLNLIQGRFSGDTLNGKYMDASNSEYTVEVTGNETDPIVIDDINLTSG